VKKLDVLLANCYEHLGNPDLQLTTARRALSVDPVWPPARLSLASALAATGRLDEAVAEYRKLPGKEPSVLLVTARLLMVRNLRLPTSERRWAEAEELIDELAKLEPDSLEVPLLRAEILLASRKTDEAQKVLETARDKNPKHLPFWLALTGLA